MPTTEVPDVERVGQSLDIAYERQLRRRVADLMGVAHERFPGAQPVSFAQQHLDELEHENYFVSEKADGVRCLMFCNRNPAGGHETFLIDRKNKYYYVNVLLPMPDNPSRFHTDTILDGELVLDIDGSQRILRFLLFDLIVIDGKNLMERTFDKRLGYMREYILKPYDKLRKMDPRFAQSAPFKIELKKLELSYWLTRVFDEVPSLKHGSDGLLFTARDAPYVVGKCEKMIKWKPGEENTVDFRIDVRPNQEYMLQILANGNVYEDVAVLHPEPELIEAWKQDPPQHKIVECRFDPEWPNNWRYARFRDDKDLPNHISVMESINQSIVDNVSKEELIARVSTWRRAWKIRNNEPLGNEDQVEQESRRHLEKSRAREGSRDTSRRGSPDKSRCSTKSASPSNEH